MIDRLIVVGVVSANKVVPLTDANEYSYLLYI